MTCCTWECIVADQLKCLCWSLSNTKSAYSMHVSINTGWLCVCVCCLPGEEMAPEWIMRKMHMHVYCFVQLWRLDLLYSISKWHKSELRLCGFSKSGQSFFFKLYWNKSSDYAIKFKAHLRKLKPISLKRKENGPFGTTLNNWPYCKFHFKLR